MRDWLQPCTMHHAPCTVHHAADAFCTLRPEELLAHELGEAVALTLAATPRSVGQGAVMHEGVMGPGHVHQVEAGAAPAASQNSQAAGDAAGRCSPPSGPPSTAVGHPAAEGQMQVGAKGCPGAGDGAGHVPGSTAAGAAAAPKPGRKLGSRLSQLHVQQLLFRGLRLKVGWVASWGRLIHVCALGWHVWMWRVAWLTYGGR